MSKLKSKQNKLTRPKSLPEMSFFDVFIIIETLKITILIQKLTGEGRLECTDDTVLESIQNENLAPIRYSDDSGTPTLQYPLNPNGSPHGVAALVSREGRHLAMMPHPERCFMSWQLPWKPLQQQQQQQQQQGVVDSDTGPWLKMFENAYEWCINFHS